jgi:hypothetical protein
MREKQGRSQALAESRLIREKGESTEDDPVTNHARNVQDRVAPKHKEEVQMYLTDIVWWAYTAFVVVLALFMLAFAYAVREKGD